MAFFRPRVAATTSTVVGASSVELIPAGVGPNYRSISNISGQIVYILFGTGTALSTVHTVAIAAGGFYEFPSPMFAGPVQAILATGSGSVLVTTY